MTESPIVLTNKPLPFEDLSPQRFELMCFWLVEREGYLRPQHLGEAGSEQGRDIIAYKPADAGEQLWYFQCKHKKRISADILKIEIDKYNGLAKSNPNYRPVGVVFVISAIVSARTRDAVEAYCREYGYACEFWAHSRLDMLVKKHLDIRDEFFPDLAGPLDRLQQLADDLKQIVDSQPARTSSETPVPNGDSPETQMDYPPPGGTQPRGSPMYVRRAIDDVFERAVLRSGNIIIIRGHTNTGKSSLLASGLAHAKKAGRYVIRPDLQDAVRIARSHPDHADDFFLEIAASIWWAMGESRQGSDSELPRRVWSSLSARNRLLSFVQNYVLVNFNERVVLAMDKVNLILNTPLGDDFHELMVTWQDDIVNNSPVWDKLTIVITFSTESYLLADDIAPLWWPFGTVIDVPDFNQKEIQCLKQRYSDPQGKARLAQVEVQDVARLLGGHPYLTHVALDAIAQRKVRDWQELSEIAVDEEHSPFREHLERRYDRINTRPELGLVDALRQIVREHTCYDQKRFLRLESAGLVRRESRGYHCRYELYERYFSSRL